MFVAAEPGRSAAQDQQHEWIPPRLSGQVEVEAVVGQAVHPAQGAARVAWAPGGPATQHGEMAGRVLRGCAKLGRTFRAVESWDR